MPASTYLVDRVVDSDAGIPVRTMEALVAEGPDATAAVVEALDRLDDEPAAYAVLWLLVVLGRLGDDRAAEPLLRWVTRAEAPRTYRSAAAEGLARLGEPGLRAIRRRLDDTPPEAERLWLYAALGWMSGVEGAHERLLEALETDDALVDVVAQALSEWGRQEDLPALLDTLEGCEPWQRVDVEDAVRTIYRGEHLGPSEPDRDWRLRYRVHPGMGTVAPSWPVVASILRADEARNERAAPPPGRSLEDILADAPEPEHEVERCDECGEPIAEPTGLPVCPDTALATAILQHRFLGQARDEGIEDLFELLDEVEFQETRLRHGEEPGSRKGRRRRAEKIEELAIERATCRWLIEQGVEDVGAGRAVLLGHAARLRDLHGDPDRLLEPASMPARADATPGRNDPCPCGSGRKYKKCCGRAGG